jgi:oxalyl-CoA decarboxylase
MSATIDTTNNKTVAAPQQPDESDLTNGMRMIVRSLKDNGFDTIFGVVGIPVSGIAFWAQKEGMRYIGFRHEQSASYAAQISGFLNKKPGILLTVSGPGFLNGMTGVANATVNCFPVIHIAGSSDRQLVDLNEGEYEGIDQMNAAVPYTKASFRIDKIEDIPLTMERAIRAASSGRPGGVYVDVTTEVLGARITKEEAEPLFYKADNVAPAIIPSTESVDKLLQKLSEAKHPLIILGKGAAYAQVDEDIKKFIETTGIPYLPMSMAKGLLPDNHPQSAASARSLSLENADLYLFIGARINWMLGFGVGNHWNTKAVYAQIDIDPEEIGNARKIDAPVVGDLASVLKVIFAEMPKYTIKPADDWLAMIQKASAVGNAKFEAKLAVQSYPLTYQTTLGVIKNVLDDYKDIILVNEGANTLDDTRDAIPRYFPRTRLDCGTWAIMGIGMGYSIGAAVSTGKQVIAIEGDSAFGFSGMEISTICRYKLPVTVVVFNNGGIYRGDTVNASGGSDPSPYTLNADARYDMMIEAFGGKGYCVDKATDLEVALKEALASKQPALINVKIDIHDGKESGHIGYLNPTPLPGISY